jgi:hypothetical protein
VGTFRQPGGGRPDECTMTAYQLVGVNADIKITPTVECGPISVICLETTTPRNGKRPREGWEQCEGKSCKLQIHQDLCVAVPVTFRTSAVCRLDQVICGPASTDPCACLPPGLSDGSSSEDPSTGSDGSPGCSDSSGSGSDSSSSRADGSGHGCHSD